MATANDNAITKEERQTLVNALDLLITSLARSAKSGRAATIREAFEQEATKAKQLQAKIASGKLDL